MNNHARMKLDKYSIVLAGIILLFVSANVIWIKLDQAPPMMDQSHYLENSEILYHTLSRKGLLTFLEEYTDILRIKAPLITVLPVPFYILFGDNYKSALYVNLLFVLVGSYCLFKLVGLMYGKREALVSVFLVNTFPLVFGLSREFLVEYGLMVFGIAWFYCLLKSDVFADRKYSCASGLVLGLGTLMKVSFGLYIIAPTLYVVIRKVLENKKIGQRGINILIALLIGILLSATWYFKNLPHVVQFALQSGFGESSKVYGMGAVFSLKTVVNYWLLLINHGISVYYFLLFILLLFLKLILFRKRTRPSGAERAYSSLLILWFIVPFLVFTFGVNKDYRYVAPFLPPLGILMSATMGRIFTRRYSGILITALLLFPAFNYLFISFYSVRPVYLYTKEFMLLSNHLMVAHPPVKEEWPDEQLVKFIHNDAMRNNNNAFTAVLFNHLYLNYYTLNYYSEKNDFNLRFGTINANSNETNEVIARSIEEEADYLIAKSEELGPAFTNTRNIPVLSLLREGKLNFTQIASVPLPDRTFLSLYKKDKSAFAYASVREITGYPLEAFKSVNFSDRIKLINLKVEKGKSGSTIAFFWECLKPVTISYKVFVHIKDEGGKDIFNADHYPAHKRYPTCLWEKGEIIKDEVALNRELPERFHIVIGLYEEVLGSRLLVKDRPVNDPSNVNGIEIY